MKKTVTKTGSGFAFKFTRADGHVLSIAVFDYGVLDVRVEALVYAPTGASVGYETCVSIEDTDKLAFAFNMWPDDMMDRFTEFCHSSS